jgi:hypothetical protein
MNRRDFLNAVRSSKQSVGSLESIASVSFFFQPRRFRFRGIAFESKNLAVMLIEDIQPGFPFASSSAFDGLDRNHDVGLISPNLTFEFVQFGF